MKRLRVSWIFSFFLMLLTGLSVLATPALAVSWAIPDLKTFNEAIRKTESGGVNAEGAHVSSVVNNLWGLNGMMIGLTGNTDEHGRPESFHYNNSAAAGIGNAIAGLYGSPPASTYAFAVDVGETLGFIPKQTYAQGVGFSGLRPLLGIWKVFRNIAYGIIAIIIVIVGFMVMLRTKIDPKTVVSVQNAIPKIVWALILVTFSYAIVGFLIDLMYVLMLLLASMLIGSYSSSVAGIQNLLPDFSKSLVELPSADKFVTSNFTTTAAVFFHGGLQSLWGIYNLFPWQAHAIASGIGGAIGFMFTGLGLKGLVAGAVAPQALVFAIIGFAVIMGLVRLFFLLLDSYINIIVSLLIAPLQLMLEAVPGVDAFGSWMRNLISKLLVFPVTVALLLITFYLTSVGDSGALWSPPLLLGDPSAKGLSGLIGLGMLLSIPSIVGSLQKLLKAEPVIPAGIGPMLGNVTGGLGQLINLYYQFSMISAYSRKDHTPSPYQQAMGAGNQNLGSILKGGGGDAGH